MNAAKVLDLMDTTSSHTWCVQETATSIEQQKSATSPSCREACRMWGVPTPTKPKQRRGWYVDQQAVPGLAIVHTEHLPIFPHAPKTPPLQEMYQAGRCVCVLGSAQSMKDTISSSMSTCHQGHKCSPKEASISRPSLLNWRSSPTHRLWWWVT